MKENKRDTILGILLILIVSVPLFMHLDHWSLRMWDESRLALNALEMAESNNFLVTQYNGKPDMWNTKPPMMIWLQALSMKILGYNELAVRLPAAVAGLGTILMLFVFFAKVHSRSFIGFIAGLTLATTPGYVYHHVTRTGDYDSLLIFWMMLVAFLAFLWFQKKDIKYLKWCSVAVVCMGLTKGIQGFMIFPGIFLYAVFSRKLFWILKQRQFWLHAVAVIIGILSYYFLRELFNPGYLQAVWNEELAGRFGREQGAHLHPIRFYYDQLINRDIPRWIYILPFTPLPILISKNKSLRALYIYFALLMLSYFLFITISKTKLEWYPAPIFPMVAILIAISIGELLEFFTTNIRFLQGNVRFVLYAMIVIAMFRIPYQNSVDYAYQPLESERHNWWNHKTGHCLQTLAGYDQLSLVIQGYNAQAEFYAKAATLAGKNYDVRFAPQLIPGQYALLCQDKSRKIVNENFIFEEIRKCELCEVIKITKRKNE